jgi:hypothetical protein
MTLYWRKNQRLILDILANLAMVSGGRWDGSDITSIDTNQGARR